MKAFLAIIKMSFQLTLQFRADLVSWMLLDSVPFIVLISALGTILQSPVASKLTTVASTTHYFLGVFLITQLCTTHLDNTRAEEIRLGKIDYDLTKPYSFLTRVVATDFGEKLIHILFLLPLVILFFYQSPSPMALVVGITLFIISYCFQLIFALWVMMSTFWIERAHGMSHFVMITLSFFSGAMLPPALLPDWLLSIIKILPFQFTYLTPITATQGSMPTSGELIYLASSMIVFILITKFLWLHGLRRYSSAGG